MRVVLTFWRLSGRDRRAIVESAFLLGATAVLLRIAGWRGVQRRVRLANPNGGSASAARLAVLFRAVARRLPVRCLSRSLALRWLLARHGYASELRIGVRRSGAELAAHAWVEHAGEVLNDAADVRSDYATLEPLDLPAAAHWS
jgi:hypothetical protein